MSSRLCNGFKLLGKLRKRGLCPGLVIRMTFARFRSYGFNGLLHRLEYWTHRLGLEDSRSKRRERIRRLARLDYDKICELRRVAHSIDGPRITVLILAGDGCRHLQAGIESILRQLYDNWDLHVVCDAAAGTIVRGVLSQFGPHEGRIRMAESDAGLGAAADAALSKAEGELVAVLPADGRLREDALLLAAGLLRAGSAARALYSDECEVVEDGRVLRPLFKPDWNAELLLGHNYVGSFFVAETDLLRKAGGFGLYYKAALGHELVLRLVRACDGERICHVPYLIYQRRADPGAAGALVDGGSMAAGEAGRLAVQHHLTAIGRPAEVLPGPLSQTYRIRFPLPQPRPLVSIIIPTRNAAGLLRRCVESIFEKTAYEHFEVLVVDNQTDEPEAEEYLNQCAARAQVRVLSYNRPFNYSAINNFGASESAGEYLCLLNNDTEVITPEWLGELVMWAFQPGIGAVGAKLLYPDGSIQHAGITLGIMGLVGHAYRGIAAEEAADIPLLAVAHEVGAVTGACLLVSRAHFEAAGRLDEEHLAVSYNDVDLCLRLRSMGLHNIWTPHAALYHHESRSRGRDDSPAKRERFEKEANFILAKWGPELLKDPTYNPNLSLNREDYALGWRPRAPAPAQYLEGLLKRG
jgi:GT2 family glycosyltransferase